VIDSRDKGERILQAMRLRAAEGKHMGPVRIGYHVVYRPDGTKVLEVVQDLAPRIRRLFDLAATGTYALRILVDEARHMGLQGRMGKPLSCSGIHTILRDPLYKGYIQFDGIVARGVHAPLVDEVVWDRVQAALSGRWTAASRPKELGLRELFVFGSPKKTWQSSANGSCDSSSPVARTTQTPGEP
jgi:site-specific DNA recombinase